jgi:hypothetical protein
MPRTWKWPIVAAAEHRRGVLARGLLRQLTIILGALFCGDAVNHHMLQDDPDYSVCITMGIQFASRRANRASVASAS